MRDDSGEVNRVQEFRGDQGGLHGLRERAVAQVVRGRGERVGLGA